ncbi:hypothetical protein D3C80_1141630 [compost metagenome]
MNVATFTFNQILSIKSRPKCRAATCTVLLVLTCVVDQQNSGSRHRLDRIATRNECTHISSPVFITTTKAAGYRIDDYQADKFSRFSPDLIGCNLEFINLRRISHEHRHVNTVEVRNICATIVLVRPRSDTAWYANTSLSHDVEHSPLRYLTTIPRLAGSNMAGKRHSSKTLERAGWTVD